MTILDLQIQQAKEAFRTGLFNEISESCKLAMIARPCVNVHQEGESVRKQQRSSGFHVGFGCDPDSDDDGPTWPKA
jgi:hypothetical protein